MRAALDDFARDLRAGFPLGGVRAFVAGHARVAGHATGMLHIVGMAGGEPVEGLLDVTVDFGLDSLKLKLD